MHTKYIVKTNRNKNGIFSISSHAVTLASNPLT